MWSPRAWSHCVEALAHASGRADNQDLYTSGRIEASSIRITQTVIREPSFFFQCSCSQNDELLAFSYDQRRTGRILPKGMVYFERSGHRFGWAGVEREHKSTFWQILSLEAVRAI